MKEKIKKLIKKQVSIQNKYRKYRDLAIKSGMYSDVTQYSYYSLQIEKFITDLKNILKTK